MNKKYANEICFNWKYEGIYSFYNMTEDKEDLEEFMDPKKWNKIYAVLEENKLIGFYQYKIQNNYLYIGFGLRPDLTGQGLGKKYVLDGIHYLLKQKDYKDKIIRLNVAEFNKRAISLYTKIGFIIKREYLQRINNINHPFVMMEMTNNI